MNGFPSICKVQYFHDIRKQNLLRISLNHIKIKSQMATKGPMYISLWENYRGHDISVLCHFLRKLMVSNNKIHRAELIQLLCTHSEKFFIFTIYQNYTLALNNVTFNEYVRVHVVQKWCFIKLD